jgi:2',3'-cyclic-nucleotide 2'-phosphodiesterase (5'-nucleotidase family)
MCSRQASVTFFAASLLSAWAATADYSLTISHANDFHVGLEPIRKYAGLCSVEHDTEGNWLESQAIFYALSVIQ